MRRTPALIVGGGPAGAAAAIAFARAGYDHLLIERSRETGDALCGGFLSWRTLETLKSLGIAPDALNSDDITRVRLFTGGHVAESSLPHPSKAVSRRRLDSLLLDAAIASGAAVERGSAARSFEDGRIAVGDEVIEADAILLATGKHDLRGLPRPPEARGSDPTLGLRMRLAPSPHLARLIGDAIELHLFDRGYAGLVRQEDGSANLCLAVHRSRLDAAGTPHRLIAGLGDECPALAERLGGIDPAATVDAVANVPYGWRAEKTSPNVFRLGDQAGVIPSLAGEGMGIALTTGIGAARAVLVGQSANEWQAGTERALARPIAIADTVRVIAERPAGANILVALARLAPSLVSLAARLTRIKHIAVDAPRPPGKS